MKATSVITTLCLAISLNSFATSFNTEKGDTTIVVKDKIIEVKEDGSKYTVILKKTVNGDTLNCKKIFEGNYDTDKKEEKHYLSSSVRLPFFCIKGKKTKEWSTETSFLSFGFNRLYISGDGSDHINIGKSNRFSLGLFSASIKKRNLAFTLGTSLDYNRIYFADNYFLNKDKEGNTVSMRHDGQELNKSKLNIVYFNTFGRVNYKPFQQFREFHVYGFAGVKIRTSSYMKIWPKEGSRESFDADTNLSPAVLELGAGIGYSFINLEATYSPTSIFKSGKGPEMCMGTIGIRLFL